MAIRSRRCLFAGGLMLGAATLSACPGGEQTSDDSSGPLDCDEGLRDVGGGQPQLRVNRDVDILFVIDNSGSMAEEQARLVSSIGPLIERLDQVDANYHIGFTTTDNGNPWCPAGTTTPEAGELVLSPCTERLDDFLYNNGTIDAQNLACTDLCALDGSALAITPTTTSLDDSAVARPWLERSEGVTNFAAGTSLADAFACFAPQGISGCGFESPLESMSLALTRAQDLGQPEAGFLRASSVLAVVLISDEADCSYNADWSEIFAQDGDKVFWSDPAASFPSSAVCWNAGVSCTGDPSAYDGCEPANKTSQGLAAIGDADAVLHPVGRVREELLALEQFKQELDPSREIIVSLIAGVEGTGADATVRYADAEEPEFQLAYGIGPGCVDALGDAAVPPVRMRALAEGFSPDGLSSICADDYGPAMAGLGDRIVDQLPPTCLNKCVADVDPSTPALDVSCEIEQDPPGLDNHTPVELCARDDDGQFLIDAATGTYQLPAGLDVCYVTLTDDARSPSCADQGANLEFEIVRREGRPAIDGTVISADCELADCPDLDCPNLY